jgi:hypothetical protein
MIRTPRRTTGIVAAIAATLAGAASGAHAATDPEIVVSAPWGAGSDELGRTADDPEGAPIGPMSFAVAADGRIWILDPVNRRLVRFANGRADRWIPLAGDAWQDVALGPDGGLWILDRLVGRRLERLDESGRPVASIPVEGAGVREGGGVTALLPRDDGVWLEVEHTRSVRVADAQGAAAHYRIEAFGRPAGPSGRSLFARRDGSRAVEVRALDTRSELLREVTTVAFDDPVWRIAALEARTNDEVVLAAHLVREGPAPTFAVAFETLEVRVLAPDLSERRRFRTTPSVGAWEQFREFRVAPDGTIFQMAFVEAGVEVRRWRF